MARLTNKRIDYLIEQLEDWSEGPNTHELTEECAKAMRKLQKKIRDLQWQAMQYRQMTQWRVE